MRTPTNPTLNRGAPGITACCVMAIVFTGCSGAVDNAPVRVEGTGMVTLDGIPLETGRVIFVSETAGDKIKATPHQTSNRRLGPRLETC